jgi:hypothetical protein
MDAQEFSRRYPELGPPEVVEELLKWSRREPPFHLRAVPVEKYKDPTNK